MVWSVYEEIVSSGLHPNVYIYNTLINAHCMGGKLKKSFELLDEIKTKNIDPIIVTYDILISGLCKEDMVQGASDMFKTMQALYVALNLFTYRDMMDG